MLETVGVFEKWWIGLRQVEKESYAAQGLDFTEDEANYRRGFEAAQDLRVRGKSYQAARKFLATQFPEMYRADSFKRGYERGLEYRNAYKPEIRS